MFNVEFVLDLQLVARSPKAVVKNVKKILRLSVFYQKWDSEEQLGCFTSDQRIGFFTTKCLVVKDAYFTTKCSGGRNDLLILSLHYF